MKCFKLCIKSVEKINEETKQKIQFQIFQDFGVKSTFFERSGLGVGGMDKPPLIPRPQDKGQMLYCECIDAE